MVRLSPAQVPSTALDEAGLSVTVSARSAADARRGTVFDATDFAAAAPVHFHRLTTGEYLMVFSRRWRAATPSPTDPGGYLSYTEDTSPGWARVAVPSGQRVAIGDSPAIPVRGSYSTAELVDAVSRSTEYLYLLLSATTGDTITGVVAHWCHNTTTGTLMAVAEETVPSATACPSSVSALAWAGLDDTERQALGTTVTFDRGLQFRTPHLIVFGTDDEDRLFMARKPWGRIGFNRTASPDSLYRAQVSETAEDPRWVYYTGEGWSVDPALAAPVRDATGAAITTVGSVSVASYRDRTWLAVVVADGAQRHARIYSQRADRPWSAEAATIALGSTADGSYLGAAPRFQQQVMPLLTGTTMSDNESGLLYVVNTKTTAAGVSTLVNTWGVWPIPRPGVTRIAQATATADSPLVVSGTPTASADIS